MSHDHEDRQLIRAIELLSRSVEHLAKHCGHGEKTKPGIRLIIIGALEPIKKEKHMDPLNLGQIPLGFRVPVSFVPDEAVDVKSDGNFASVTVTSGDATAQIAPGSTAKGWKAFFNGDGAIGLKSADVAADGHVGDGDVEIIQSVTWEVTSPDATTFTSTVGPLEPIPTTPVPLAAKK